MCVCVHLAQIIYADCESVIRPLEEPQHLGRHTTRLSEHLACSVGYVVIRSDGVETSRFFYRGKPSGMCLVLEKGVTGFALYDVGEDVMAETCASVLCYL